MTTYTSPSGLISAAPERGPFGNEIPGVWILTHRDGRYMGYATASSEPASWQPPRLHPASTGLTVSELIAIAEVISSIELDIQGGQS